jgi:hypothetical protein
MSIGSPKEKFPPLKTKDLVDHAGLSPSNPPSNPKPPSSPEDSQDFLNNNSSIVTEPQEIWDVQEVGHQPLLTIYPEEESVPLLLILMKPETETVENLHAQKMPTPLEDTLLSPEDPPALSNLPIKVDPSLSVSTLPHGLSTLVVS